MIVRVEFKFRTWTKYDLYSFKHCYVCLDMRRTDGNIPCYSISLKNPTPKDRVVFQDSKQLWLIKMTLMTLGKMKHM